MVAMLLGVLVGASGMRVGTARVDITPTDPLPLGGYTERKDALAEPGGEPLFARAVAFREGTTSVVVVASDMLTTPDSLVREVAARLPAGTHLFLSATHTHSAPDSQMLNDRMTLKVPGIANYKRSQLEWTAERLAQAARLALASATQPVGEVDVWERHVPANRPRRRFGVPDDMLTCVLPGTGDPWIAHFAAHAVVYGPDSRTTNGDWPSHLGYQLRAVAVLPGAIGDVSPIADGPTGAARMEAFLGRFAGLDLALGRRTVWRAGDPMVWVEQPIALAAVKPHPTFGSAYGVPDVLAQMVVTKFAPTQAAIRAFRVGKLAVVGVPGEPTGQIGRRIRDAGRRLGFGAVLVVSHVDGWIGYILEPADYARGGYEATLSFHGPDTGERVVEAGVAALRRLARP